MSADSVLLLACGMLQPEIKKIIKTHHLQMPVIWLDSGLHDQPKALKKSLQTLIDQHQDYTYILLAFCLCGNSVLGLLSPQTSLIIPKFDDCIRMFMSLDEKRPPQISASCLYYTGGWLDCGGGLMAQMRTYAERYGETKAQKALSIIYKNYTDLKLIDTAASEINKHTMKAMETANQLELKFELCQGSYRVLEKLLLRQWDDEFCLVKPAMEVTAAYFHNKATKK